MGWSQEELIMKSGFLVKEKGEAASASRGAGGELLPPRSGVGLPRDPVPIVFLFFPHSTNT